MNNTRNIPDTLHGGPGAVVVQIGLIVVDGVTKVGIGRIVGADIYAKDSRLYPPPNDN